MSEDASRQWMTYAEIAEALGLPSSKAGEAKARRSKWERIIGNDGFAKVAVPRSVLEEPHPLRRPNAASTRRPYVGAATAPPTNALMDELRQRAATAEDRSRELAGELAVQHERAGRAEGEATGLRDALAHERAEAARERNRREAAERELEVWTAGGSLARAWRALVHRRGRP
jgi:hypothetical protein